MDVDILVEYKITSLYNYDYKINFIIILTIFAFSITYIFFYRDDKNKNI
jgi:hypothetical protein